MTRSAPSPRSATRSATRCSPTPPRESGVVSWAEWQTLATGLAFPEAPRWRDGRLYVSEIFGERVVAIDERGSVEVVLGLPGRRPSGLGWRPDGSMLVVSMQEREPLTLTAGRAPQAVAGRS